MKIPSAAAEDLNIKAIYWNHLAHIGMSALYFHHSQGRTAVHRVKLRCTGSNCGAQGSNCGAQGSNCGAQGSNCGATPSAAAR